MDKDTIAAIATPLGSGGIGIVRISGPDALLIAQRIFTPRQGNRRDTFESPADPFVSHQLQLGHIIEPSLKEVIDEVLLVAMKAPRSYTREDVVEIQSHAGFVVLGRILKAVLASGARLAEPGEFTKRAFLSGRIDLSQAEAIAEMICARSEAGQQLAATHLTGGLKKAVQGFLDALIEVQIELEAGIEFPDEIESTTEGEHSFHLITDCVIQPIEALLQHYDEGHVYRDGVRMDIVGRPNVGKSSILNRLINKDKAIVTPTPGTTRDLVEDQINITGIPLLITDTAGLHQSEDPIEIIGMQKTRENIERSDLVLWVVDGSQGITKDDQSILDHLSGRKALLVINKKDLMPEDADFQFPDTCKDIPRLFISAKFGEGINALKETIREMCLSDIHIDPGRSLVPNVRQKTAFESALDFLRSAASGIATRSSDELVVADIVAGKNALGLITGEQVSDDILDEIFGKFCIGK